MSPLLDDLTGNLLYNYCKIFITAKDLNTYCYVPKMLAYSNWCHAIDNFHKNLKCQTVQKHHTWARQWTTSYDCPLHQDIQGRISDLLLATSTNITTWATDDGFCNCGRYHLVPVDIQPPKWQQFTSAVSQTLLASQQFLKMYQAWLDIIRVTWCLTEQTKSHCRQNIKKNERLWTSFVSFNVCLNVLLCMY